jgi:hypothetical protein
MINAFVLPFQRFLKNPFLVLPAVVYFIVSFFLFVFSLESIIEIVLFFFSGINVTFTALPLHLIFAQPSHVMAFFVYSFASVFLFNWLVFSLTYSLINRTGIADSCLRGVSYWTRIAGLSIVFYSAGLLYVSAGLVILNFSFVFTGFLGFFFLLFLIFYALAGVYIALRMVFAPIALADSFKARNALQESWGFTRKNFFKTIAVLFLVSVAYSFLMFILSFIAESEGFVSDVLFFLVVIFSFTYFCMVLIEFYEDTKPKNPFTA